MSCISGLMFDKRRQHFYNAASKIVSRRYSSIRLERGIHNPEVPGSIPGIATIKTEGLGVLPSPFFMPSSVIRSQAAYYRN